MSQDQASCTLSRPDSIPESSDRKNRTSPLTLRVATGRHKYDENKMRILIAGVGQTRPSEFLCLSAESAKNLSRAGDLFGRIWLFEGLWRPTHPETCGGADETRLLPVEETLATPRTDMVSIGVGQIGGLGKDCTSANSIGSSSNFRLQ